MSCGLHSVAMMMRKMSNVKIFVYAFRSWRISFWTISMECDFIDGNKLPNINCNGSEKILTRIAFTFLRTFSCERLSFSMDFIDSLLVYPIFKHWKILHINIQHYHLNKKRLFIVFFWTFFLNALRSVNFFAISELQLIKYFTISVRITNIFVCIFFHFFCVKIWSSIFLTV